jgi:hypothetical protein
MSDLPFAACGLSEQSLNPKTCVDHSKIWLSESFLTFCYYFFDYFFFQKARLSALESLRTSSSRSIVVASDVAARGLDIQAVTTVVHYDVARVVDTFIHRAGRTAVGYYSATPYILFSSLIV